MKISIDADDLELILRKHKIDQKVAEFIVKDAEQVAEDNKPDPTGKAPKAKYKYLVVASDPDGLIPNLENVPMWVFKVPEEEKHTEVMARFFKGVYDFNAKSRKGRKNPIKSVGDGIQAVGSKHFKPAKSPIVTKEPVIVLVTDNKIPN